MRAGSPVLPVLGAAKASGNTWSKAWRFISRSARA
jgi:hypothetical protein